MFLIIILAIIFVALLLIGMLFLAISLIRDAFARPQFDQEDVDKALTKGIRRVKLIKKSLREEVLPSIAPEDREKYEKAKTKISYWSTILSKTATAIAKEDDRKD